MMRAVGASRGDVFRVILIESFLLAKPGRRRRRRGGPGALRAGGVLREGFMPYGPPGVAHRLSRRGWRPRASASRWRWAWSPASTRRCAPPPSPRSRPSRLTRGRGEKGSWAGVPAIAVRDLAKSYSRCARRSCMRSRGVLRRSAPAMFCRDARVPPGPASQPLLHLIGALGPADGRDGPHRR